MASLSPQSLSQEEQNLLRNDRIKFECGSVVYQTIIEWGFEKPDGVKIKDHFEKKKIEEKSDLQLGKWLKRSKVALDKEDFSSFNVPTLQNLLPVLCCDKVSQTGGKEWEAKLKDTNSIEYLLKTIECFRNHASHEYSEEKEDFNIEDMKELLRKCIRTAGTLYGKDQIEIDSKVADLEAKFDDVMYGTTSSYENAVNHVTELLERESVSFKLERFSSLFTVALPSGVGNIQSSDIFQSVNLSVDVEDKDNNGKKKSVFSSTEICNHVTNKFVVINGSPGSGKTTLMRNIFQNILVNSVNECESSYEGIGKFRVPIYLECRIERQNNLRDFLQEDIPNFKSPKEVIYDAFKKVEGLVFLVDGYDEVDDKSRQLVEDAIDFCSKYNATCIVSDRVDAGSNFTSKLKERNLSYKEIFIEPINELSDKLSSLRRYGDKMGDDVDSVELVDSFENLNDAVQEVFFSPVHLALFISLFLNNRSSLSQLHNEQNAYKAIREIFCNEIERKLKESNVPNPEEGTKNILALFSYYSLKFFNCEKYFFKENDYDNLVEKCEQELSTVVDIGGLLTCILTPETSLKLGKALTYAFPHSTIQEYLAVEQIIKNMRESNIDWNSDQLSEDSLREKFLDSVEVSNILLLEVKRYGNIIKLLILETVANGELTKYTKTFTAVLREYFIPECKNSPDFLLDFVSSSNCDSSIASIVSDVLRDVSDYLLHSTRHIRPLTEVLKKVETKVDIWFEFSESLTDTDCANFRQLVSVLKDDSEIRLNFKHSFDNYQPVNGEFYTQLNDSRCKVTYFKACVTSTEHLSIVMRAWRGGRHDSLFISTVSASDFNFPTLETRRGRLFLRVKYTDNCPNTGSNPVGRKTNLLIADVPADGAEKLYNILKYLCPKSKKFQRIGLVNCYLTDTDANELLKKLEGEKIKILWETSPRVYELSVNEDKSRNLTLSLVSE